MVKKSIKKIICGDNLEILQNLPNESVDLCYIDLYRILKRTGSFYLHCDYHADSYLRVVCDNIFGYKNMKSKIIWKRCSPHDLSNEYDNITDTILFYVKSTIYTFNIQYRSNKNLTKFSYIEPITNRKFNPIASLEQKQNFKFNGETRTFYYPSGKKVVKTTDIGWRWSQKTIDERWAKNNRIFYFTSNGKLRYKIYADNYAGQRVHSLWDDITYLSSSSKENLNYPTQKPESLLERIIKTSSNEYDLVLDAFCGSGTTLLVAKKLNRQFIGIDKNKKAILLAKKRIKANIKHVKLMGYGKKEKLKQ